MFYCRFNEYYHLNESLPPEMRHANGVVLKVRLLTILYSNVSLLLSIGLCRQLHLLRNYFHPCMLT